ncbi:MAG TPA: DUF2382 domain-containing protein [Burkholderiaceae bacterium]|nr:DUF2382 domain-containing protein [Burkholderiaceae bacterium]
MKPSSSFSSKSTDPHPASRALPVIEEQLELGKHVQDVGGVRVRIEVDEQVHDVVAEGAVEETIVERVSVNQPVAAPRAPWRDGETLVVPVYEEEIVLERRLVLKEEVRLTKRRVMQPSVQQATVRRERVVVERQTSDGVWRRVEPLSDT